ncbi:hypothetical protein I4F81_004949 [Pyropia yezoensis]|uniref:Uncharacterized protein n=1 Tax=Pyropia yezoensis TaxID=2788 RepID=A0ACC3BWW3_PYRYE|nr:hypothetical protein I4F81_004949 [Neopyropia yezoensis]
MGIALAECHANGYTFSAKMSSAILLHQAGLTKHEEAKTFAAASVNTIADTTGLSALSTALRDLWGGGKKPSQTGGPALVTINKAEHHALLARRIAPPPRTPGRRDTAPPPPAHPIKRGITHWPAHFPPSPRMRPTAAKEQVKRHYGGARAPAPQVLATRRPTSGVARRAAANVTPAPPVVDMICRAGSGAHCGDRCGTSGTMRHTGGGQGGALRGDPVGVGACADGGPAAVQRALVGWSSRGVALQDGGASTAWDRAAGEAARRPTRGCSG